MGKGKRHKKKRRADAESGSRQAAVAERSPGDFSQEGSKDGSDDRDSQSAKPKKGKSRPRPETTYDWIRENLEAIIVAFVLALIIRHFSVEAFEIPTGSMAPTLFGIHSWLDCPNCDERFNVGLPSDSKTGNLTLTYSEVQVHDGPCPRCKLRDVRSFFRGRRLRPGHDKIVCENCDNRWQGKDEHFRLESVVSGGRDIGTLHRDLKFECPWCQFRFRDVLTQSNQYGGHKILVNKFAYKIGSPRRWDIIVFQKDEEHNYIKRLLGMPGEEVSLRGGDLYVRGPDDDGFHIIRKDDRPEVREALWFKIADTDLWERGYNHIPAWIEKFEKGSRLGGGVDSKYWTWKGEKNQLRWSVNILQPSGRTAILHFNRKCEDSYNYNLLRSQGTTIHAVVGDKKVAFAVTPTKESNGKGWIGAEIRDGPFTFQMRLPVGTPDPARLATLRRLPTEIEPRSPSPGRPPEKLPEYASLQAQKPFALPLMKQSRVEFENTDDRVAVRVDGEEILSLEYRSDSPDLNEEEAYLVLLASGTSAELESIQIFRDIHYSYAQTGLLHGREATLEIGSRDDPRGRNWYFPCGDNSPSSSDGRYWGTAPEQNMMGQAFLIFWPAIPAPGRWQCGFIR